MDVEARDQLSVPPALVERHEQGEDARKTTMRKVDVAQQVARVLMKITMEGGGCGQMAAGYGCTQAL